jgi:signal transduction histidine kinase
MWQMLLVESTPFEILYVLGYLVLIAGLLLRRERPVRRVVWLVVYLLVQTAWALALDGMHFSPPFYPPGLAVIAHYLVLVALVALLAATLALVQSRPRAWLWLILPLALTGAALALDARIWGPRDWVTIDGWRFMPDALYTAASVSAWASAVALAIGFVGHARVFNPSPLHRNRLRYWITALILIAVGTGLILSPALWLPGLSLLGGGLVTLLGSLVAVITWRTYFLPDMRVTLRRAISYVVITLVTFAIFFFGILFAQLTFRMQTGLEPLLGAVIVAVVLALGYAPLRHGVQALTQRVLGGAPVDYATSLQNYSQRITQVLDLDMLASMVLQTAHSALRISRGALFLVQDSAHLGLTLHAIGGLEAQAPSMLECPMNSPITQRWRDGGGPLLQYEVDVLPAFRQVTMPERAILAAWQMEVYIPIRTMGQITGALAVGSKQSREPYFESDVAYLAALADQTGVALQNARLFSDLRAANRQMAGLNRDLEDANQQLHELDKLKSAFIGVITHELRSPFAALDFSMQLIQRHGLDNLLPEQREQLEQLAEGLQRAETLINNLITFAALLSKQGQLHMTPVDLGQVAKETIRVLEPLAQAREVKMSLQISAGLPIVYCDRERLAEAIYHLAQNAVKFNHPGGSVTLACRSAPEDILFEVTDTGIGISPDKLPQMWQDFTQLADPLRRGVEGLGLGLPLVRYVVRAHGGQVWARSQPGQGSVFGFRIPLGGPRYVA